jgi:hypothetical protein
MNKFIKKLLNRVMKAENGCFHFTYNKQEEYKGKPLNDNYFRDHSRLKKWLKTGWNPERGE